MKAEKRELAHYMALPYMKSLRPDQDGNVVAQIRELPGCSAHGQDEREALANLQEAQRLWLEGCLQSGDPVPEPRQEGPLGLGSFRNPRATIRVMPTRVSVFSNGPIRIEGDFEILDPTGAAFGLAGRTVISLCRCGQSANKPFCDGAHARTGFNDPVTARDLPPPKPKL